MNNQKDVDLPLVTAKIGRLPANVLLAVLGFFFALVLAFGAAFFPPLVIGLVVLLAVLVVLGWPSLIGLTMQRTVRIGSIVVAVLGILAAIFADYHWTALVAALGIIVAFAAEMLRSKVLLRRIEQIAGNYLAIALVLSATFWIQTVNTDFGSKTAVIFAIVFAVVSLISVFTSRSVFAVSLINALVFGMGSAYLCDTRIAVGAVAGLAVPVAYRLSFEAFNHVHYQKPLLPLLTYISLPISSIGFIAFAAAGVLG